MRYYNFGNYYLSQIQQGIQALHCVTDLIYKYRFHSSIQPRIIDDWAVNHKTVILLNGGNQENLVELFNFLNVTENPFPFHFFREDESSLNNCITSIGIILPESIYNGASLLRDRRNGYGLVPGESDNAELYLIVDQKGIPLEEEPYEYTLFEINLMLKLNDYRLA